MTVYRQNTNIEKVYVYASERSERALKISAFLYSKTAISFNILLVLQIISLRNMLFLGLE